NVKKQSLSAIRLKLSALGIDKDIIDSVLLNFELDSQIDNISSLLQTKYRSRLSTPDKVVASLLRKGFKYGEIKRALNNLNIDLQEY
ncbi:MAG: RecX family transcriptional regulator, partial [Oscillospiraceae bacterium]|nr:RecX family transcriptional regulator [Oscillospiraceae bacterium]